MFTIPRQVLTFLNRVPLALLAVSPLTRNTIELLEDHIKHHQQCETNVDSLSSKQVETDDEKQSPIEKYQDSQIDIFPYIGAHFPYIHFSISTSLNKGVGASSVLQIVLLKHKTSKYPENLEEILFYTLKYSLWWYGETQRRAECSSLVIPSQLKNVLTLDWLFTFMECSASTAQLDQNLFLPPLAALNTRRTKLKSLSWLFKCADSIEDVDISMCSITPPESFEVWLLLDASLCFGRLKKLNLCATYISTLKWSSQTPNLVSLDISSPRGASITDFSPLEKLTHLETLVLHHCNVNSLLWLGGCPKLRDLVLVCNAEGSPSLFGDEYLANVPPHNGLRYLSLGQITHFTSFSPIAEKFPLLEDLNVSSCVSLEDFAPLGQLKKLRIVTFYDSNLTSLEWVSQCSQLEVLDLTSCNTVEDYACLRDVPASLRSFSASGSTINTLDWLNSEAGRQLTSLSLAFCFDISDFSPLKFASSLVKLDVYSCNLNTFEWAKSCIHLKELYFSEVTNTVDTTNKDDFFAPLASLTQLEILQIFRNSRLHTLDFLKGCLNLTLISLRECDQLKDFSVLAHLPKLKKATFWMTPLNTLEWLKSCPELEELHILNCPQIEDLTPLSYLSGVKHLTCSGTSIVDIEPISQYCSSLEGLYITENLNLTDVSPIYKLKCLKHLRCFSTQLDKDRVLASCPQISIDDDF